MFDKPLSNSRLLARPVMALLLSGSLMGCSTGITLQGLSRGSSAGGGGAAPPGKVTVTVRNTSTTLAVDVQIFSTNGSEAVIPDDLFIPRNQIRREVGVGGTGVLGPEGDDTIELECLDDGFLAIGTTGGEFLDNDTGDSVGVAARSRFVELGNQFDCGDTIVYTYSRDADGFIVTQQVF